MDRAVCLDPISYVSDIVPILNAKCNFNTCHGNNGPQINFAIYENVELMATEIKSRTQSGSMPKAPKPGGDLSEDQKAIIACWVDEGALNN